VLVDFSQVTFMDSIVIEALIHAHALAEPNREVRLAVVVDSPESFPARLLRLVGVTRRVPTLADRATALSALTSQGPH
jgi:anti-anti-sigma regulatory factor